MYRLYFFRKSTNFRLREHLIFTLLYPRIDNCFLVYCDLTAKLDLKLLRFINTGIRYIYGLRRNEHMSPYRRELGWLTVASRRKYFVAYSLRKMFSTSTPAHLISLFHFSVAVRPVKGNMLLDVRSFGTETLHKSFHVSSASLWNSLPSHIRNTDSIPHFKQLLHLHLFNIENV